VKISIAARLNGKERAVALRREPFNQGRDYGLWNTSLPAK